MNKQQSLKKEHLSTLEAIADGIAALFFPSVEVVIHDVRSGKIAYLANNLSNRAVGDDAGIEELALNDMEKLTGPYEKLNWDGKKIRSVSIKADFNNDPSYMLCINFSTSLLEDARHALELFLSVNRLQPKPTQLFEHDWQEKINTFLHQWLADHNTALSTLTQVQKKMLVTALYQHGMFNIRNSADYIANVLSMGRATLYKYLKDMKNQNQL